MGTHDFNHDGKITGFDHFMENGLANGSSAKGSAAGTGGGCLSSLLCFIGVLSAAVIGFIHILS